MEDVIKVEMRLQCVIYSVERKMQKDKIKGLAYEI